MLFMLRAYMNENVISSQARLKRIKVCYLSEFHGPLPYKIPRMFNLCIIHSNKFPLLFCLSDLRYTGVHFYIFFS